MIVYHDYMTRKTDAITFAFELTCTFLQVPMLEIDGLNIVQCDAILRYLARKNNMLGSDLAECVSDLHRLR